MNDLYDDKLVIFEKYLNLKNYSKNTINIYINFIKKFIKEVNKNPSQLTQKDIICFFDNKIFSSISQQDQYISSIKIFYRNVLNIKLKQIELIRPRKEQHLPKILDSTVLLDKISKIDNIKHKTIISLAYSTGIRVSELINLKITDIDSKRMLITIKQSKNKKDRFVPLSEHILLLLRNYYKQYKPKEYLFNGQKSLQYSKSSCNEIVKKYIDKKYHFHSLRHSCFSHLLESGTDIKYIQHLAGHSNIKTTEKYVHISNVVLSKLKLML